MRCPPSSRASAPPCAPAMPPPSPTSPNCRSSSRASRAIATASYASSSRSSFPRPCATAWRTRTRSRRTGAGSPGAARTGSTSGTSTAPCACSSSPPIRRPPKSPDAGFAARSAAARAEAPDALERQLEHRIDQLRLDPAPGEEQSHGDRADDHVGGEVEIQLGGQLAALLRALERGDQRAAAPAQDGVEQLGELRIVAAFAGQARQHRGERRLVEELEVAAQHRAQVVGEVAGVDVLELRQLVERLDDERQLRRPAPVDRGLADAGA